jgi:uncharacterized membrane protein YccC
MRSEPNPALLALRNAAENASNEPIADADIAAILRGAAGSPSHMRAIFGDVSLQGLSRAGAALGIELKAILDAYRLARDRVAAANPELDAALHEDW